MRPFVAISDPSDRFVEAKLVVLNPLNGTAKIEKPAGTAFVVYPAYRTPSSSAARIVKQAKAHALITVYFFMVNLLS
jgi:hypothetical protein